METRDRVILLLAAAGIGYAVYSNWDVIRERLGLDDMYPGRIKAIDLVKKAYSLDRYRMNWEILEDRKRGGSIQVVGDPWYAEPISEPLYKVTYTFKEAGQPRRYVFHANVATMAVHLRTPLEGEPAPARSPAPR